MTWLQYISEIKDARGLATPQQMILIKYCTSTTECNCGIGLHAHQMYVCLMDRQGNKLESPARRWRPV